MEFLLVYWNLHIQQKQKIISKYDARFLSPETETTKQNKTRKHKMYVKNKSNTNIKQNYIRNENEFNKQISIKHFL